MKVILISGESGSGKSYLGRLIFEKISKEVEENSVVILPFASFLKSFSNEFLFMSFEKDKDIIDKIKYFLSDLINKVKKDNENLINKYKELIKNKVIDKTNFFLYIYSLMNSVVNYLNLKYKDNLIDKSKIYLTDNNSFLSNIIYMSYKTNDVRTFYQYFGTDYIRKCIDEDFHIKILLDAIEKAKYHGYKYVIVDDLRFPNEKVYMKSIFKENLLHIHVLYKNSFLKDFLKKHESERYSLLLLESADLCFIRIDKIKKDKKINERRIN